jgi:hypothetical protein
MPMQQGADTDTRLTLDRPLPAEEVLADHDTRHRREAGANLSNSERRNQRFGTVCMSIGIAGFVTLSLVVAIFRTALRDGDPPFVTITTIQIWVGVSVAFLIAGLNSLNNRYQRSMARLIVEQNEMILADRFAVGQAVDEIAKHLPENQKIQEWRGFNNAVREGFVAETGTDGVAPRGGGRGLARARLGLVQPERGQRETGIGR